jgi:4-hydroxy-tetrahydrodipicolinate synthase
MAQLEGINLAMQTPMHDDGSIDYARWEALIDIYIDAGAQDWWLPENTRQRCNYGRS